MKALISGGGTGGHIYPAIAIAEALLEMVPGSQVHFAGANGRMEMEKVPAAGYQISGIDIAGFQRKNLLKNLSLPFKVLKSLGQAKKIIQEHRPDVCIGTGGYASFPLLKQAQRMGIPTYLQEQNAFAGLANKSLGKKARVIFTAWAGMEKYFPGAKVIETGNPLRNFSINISREEALKKWGFSPDRKTILVLGGSLGARTINGSVEAMLPNLAEANVNLLWQTGKTNFSPEKANTLQAAFPFLRQLPFIDNMAAAYAVADLAISRAGAISLAELAVSGVPAIIIPSPNVTDDHQTHNARALAANGAAIMFTDADAAQTLGQEVLKLVNNQPRLSDMSDKIRHFGNPLAAKQIIQHIMDDLTNSRR